MSDASYRRLQVDERRRQLLELGAELFTSRPYDELSMREIAAAAGISKALLYHYFPSKQAFFEETLGAWAEELRARTEPDPDRPAVEQLQESLGAFLALVEENAVAYRNLIASANGTPEIGELIAEVRRSTAERILAALYADKAPPKARTAVSGWLWFIDGACLDWIERRDIKREELRDLLLGVLMGALVAADALPDAAQVS